jgi:hypothetical protein
VSSRDPPHKPFIASSVGRVSHLADLKNRDKKPPKKMKKGVDNII